MLVPNLIGWPHHLSLTAPLFPIGHQHTRGKLLQPTPNHPDLKLLGFRVINPPDPHYLGGKLMVSKIKGLDPSKVEVSGFGPPKR